MYKSMGAPKGRIPWNKGRKTGYSGGGFKKGNIPWNKGKKYTAIKGKNHWNWKGEIAGYFAKHSWIKREFGKATICDNSLYKILDFKCRRDSIVYEWSKKENSKYTRNKEDYYQLCRSCHKIYDSKKIIILRNRKGQFIRLK